MMKIVSKTIQLHKNYIYKKTITLRTETFIKKIYAEITINFRPHNFGSNIQTRIVFSCGRIKYKEHFLDSQSFEPGDVIQEAELLQYFKNALEADFYSYINQNDYGKEDYANFIYDFLKSDNIRKNIYESVFNEDGL